MIHREERDMTPPDDASDSPPNMPDVTQGTAPGDVADAGHLSLPQTAELGENLFRAIFENNDLGLAVVSLEQRLLFANGACGRLLGYEPRGLVGHNLADLVDPDTELRQVLDGEDLPEGYSSEARIRHADGHFIWTSLRLSPVRDNAGTPIYYVVQIQDLSPQKQIEAERRRYLTRLMSLHRIDREILAAQSPRRSAETALAEIKKLIPCARVDVLILDDRAMQARVLAVNSDGGTAIGAGEMVPFPASPAIARALRHGDAHVTDDAAEATVLPAFYERLAAEGMRSFMCVPLQVRGKLVGGLTLGAEESHAFGEEEVAIAREVADSVATSVYSGLLLRRERSRVELLQRTNDVLTALSQVTLRAQVTLDPDAVMEAMGEALATLRLRCLVLLVAVEDRDALGLRYVSGPREPIADAEALLGIKAGEIRVQRYAMGNIARPAFVSDPFAMAVAALPGIPPSLIRRAARLMQLDAETRVARLPLLVQEEVLGVLIVWGADLRRSDLPAYSIFASQVAIALKNARSLKSESTAREQAETLREVASVLSSSLELDQVLDLILRQLARVIDYDSASIMLIRGDGYYVAARQGRLTGLEVGTVVKRYMLPGIDAIIDEQRPVIVADTDLDPDWVSFPDSRLIQSWLGVPLMVKDEVIGVLNINKDRRRFFTEEDASLATAFAQQAALAIDQARLFAQVRRYAYELEQRVIERTRDLATLYDVTAITSEPLDLETVLLRSMQSMFMSVECHGGAIYLLDELEHELHVAATMGMPMNLVAYPDSPLARTGLLDQVAVEGEADFCTFVSETDAHPLWSCAGVPMRFQGQILGVLTVCSEGERTFTNEEMALLASFADHVAAAVENARLRRQAQQLAIMQERERLAQDLHDSVTQSLYSLTLFAEAAREKLAVDSLQQTAEYLDDIAAAARRALREMRLLLFELRSDSYLKNGLLAALHHRVDAVEKRAGITATIAMDSLLELPQHVEKGLYRIAQEALNNALKHSAADAVRVAVEKEGVRVRMSISDNGHGFDPEAAAQDAGMGLESMRKRARELNGELIIESREGQETRIIVDVPLGKDKASAEEGVQSPVAADLTTKTEE